MQQFDDKIEEIRTICRLHAFPTGQWENLVDLPFRLSQDAGLRSDLVEIVRSLQRSSLHLPDVLDLMVLAVGGAMAPKHSRDLSEPLNQIGGFLSSVGRWPDTDTRPILAPGEVPENIEKFTRPQPRLRPVPPPPPPSEPPSPAPQPQIASRPVRLFEARPRRSPASSDSSPSQPIQPDPHRDKPDRPQPIQPSPEQPAQASPTFNPPEPAPRKSPDPDSPNRGPIPGRSTLVPEGDISQALGRLERGNLELRAHLDSIDQRISRMEPLLESGTPLPDLSDLRAALTDLTTSTSELPTLLHRESSPGHPLRTEPVEVEPLRPRPLRPTPADTEPIRSDPLRSDPSSGNSSAPTSARARFRSDLHSDTAAETPRRSVADEPAQRSETSDFSRGSSGPIPLPLAPRFSRFSRDPSSTDPAPLEAGPETRPLAGPAEPLPIASRPDPGLALPPDEPRPMTLPRGFFGTIPEPDEATIDMAVDPPRSRRRLALIVTVLIVLGLIAAAVALYMRSAPDAASTSSSTITPAPAARTPVASRSPNQGPTSANSTSSSASVRPNSGGSNAPLARGASQPRETLAEPVSTNGFRPAPNFVPASVMDGHLISAPMPAQPRVPASSGTQAIVVLEVNISSTGQVEDVYVLGGNAALRPAAINAVRNWRYKPYLLNGTPSEVRTVVRVDFSEHKSTPADRGAPFPR